MSSEETANEPLRLNKVSLFRLTTSPRAHSARVERRPLGIDRLGGIQSHAVDKTTHPVNAGGTACLTTA